MRQRHSNWNAAASSVVVGRVALAPDGVSTSHGSLHGAIDAYSTPVVLLCVRSGVGVHHIQWSGCLGSVVQVILYKYVLYV